MHSFVGRLLLASVLLASGAVARAAQPVPASPEFVVNPTNTAAYYGYTLTPKVTTGANGEFVVVWEGYGYGTQSYDLGIFARRLASTGVPIGTVIEVSPAGSTDGSARLAVGSDAAGNFVVAWEDPDRYVMARRMNAGGTAKGPTFQVSTRGSYSYEAEPEVAVHPAGDFLVVWSDASIAYEDDVYGHLFDANGTERGPVFVVNSYTPHLQYIPSVTATDDGNFVVAWKDYERYSIVGRRVDSTGTPLGSDFFIDDSGNADIALHQHPTALVPQPGGHFVAAWYDYTNVVARRFDANAGGGAPFVVNSGALYVDGHQAATADLDGNFVVVWAVEGDYSQNIMGQRFLPDGTPDGTEFQVNSRFAYIDAPPGIPSLAADAKGDFVVVWSNDISNGYSEDGLRARRFAVCGNGRIGTGQTCDDGNAASDDGCSDTCDVETCFACTGEPSVCNPIAGCGAVCSSAAEIGDKALLTITHILAPVGDEKISLQGAILNPPFAAGAYNPALVGAEVVIAGQDLIWGRATPTPVPPGFAGSGCGPVDGWKVSGRAPSRSYTYQNLTNALPPACVAGSANGLRVMKFKDRIAKDGTLQFQLTVKNATLPPVPAAPVSATIVLGLSPAAGTAGQCARVRFTSSTFSKSTARFYPSVKLVFPPPPENPYAFGVRRARPPRLRMPGGRRRPRGGLGGG